ncbi:Os04g0488800, partial [Oryza sativa Japonica Group]
IRSEKYGEIAFFGRISPLLAIADGQSSTCLRRRLLHHTRCGPAVIGREHLVDDLLDVEHLAGLVLVLRRGRDERRARHAEDAVPVDAVEERVRLDPARADALLGVLLQEAGDEVAQRRLLADELRLLGEDAVERLLPVQPPERRAAVEHLVEHHAQAPPVHGEVVPAAGDDLRRHVVLRAHERVRLRWRPHASGGGGRRGGGRRG